MRVLRSVSRDLQQLFTAGVVSAASGEAGAFVVCSEMDESSMN
jgi:hypothetical protein